MQQQKQHLPIFVYPLFPFPLVPFVINHGSEIRGYLFTDIIKVKRFLRSFFGEKKKKIYPIFRSEYIRASIRMFIFCAVFTKVKQIDRVGDSSFDRRRRQLQFKRSLLARSEIFAESYPTTRLSVPIRSLYDSYPTLTFAPIIL